MLTRRDTLSLGALASLTLTGCLPSPPPTPASPPPLGAAQMAVLDLHRALAAASGSRTRWSASPAQSQLLDWAVAVSNEQLDAVSVPVPTPTPSASPTSKSPAPRLSPSPSAGTSPGRTPTASASTPVSGASQPAAVRAALASARQAFVGRAAGAGAASPLVWASMAAWCAAVNSRFGTAGPLEPARERMAPASSTPEEALGGVHAAAAAIVYAFETAAGVPGLAAPLKARLLARSTAWRTLRVTLQGLAPSASPSATATPTAPPALWDVPRPKDAAAAGVLARDLQTLALPHLGRAIEFGPVATRGVLTSALAATQVDVLGWGGTAQRWPGFSVLPG